MSKEKILIDFNLNIIKNNLSALIKDKTTNKNILFATNDYSELNVNVSTSIDVYWLKKYGKDYIKPRILKSKEEQSARTKKKAEVFTPAWICNEMNNHCDNEWFGRKDVFNHSMPDHKWMRTVNKVKFKNSEDWQAYVKSNRLEITCGEAPYLVSRYDASTGDYIEIPDRIGILDRKIRVVTENTKDFHEWFIWVMHALTAVYGYEYQGDSLLIARINLLMTVVEYAKAVHGYDLDQKMIDTAIAIIVNNIWQMDGLTGLIPGTDIEAKIRDWDEQKMVTYNGLKGEN